MDSSAAYSLRLPGFVGWVTVVLITMELALIGIPQFPETRNTRPPPAASAGPPWGRAGPRVSASRHCGTVKNASAGFCTAFSDEASPRVARKAKSTHDVPGRD